MLSQDDLHVATLGLNEKPSPLNLSSCHGDGLGDFVPGAPRIRYQLDVSPDAPHQDLLFERAGPRERIYFDQLARYADHSAMAGNTDVLIGMWNNVYVHVPICTAIRQKKRMELTGELWTNVLLTTGQPRWPSVPVLACEDADPEANTAELAATN